MRAGGSNREDDVGKRRIRVRRGEKVGESEWRGGIDPEKSQGIREEVGGEEMKRLEKIPKGEGDERRGRGLPPLPLSDCKHMDPYILTRILAPLGQQAPLPLLGSVYQPVFLPLSDSKHLYRFSGPYINS